MWRRQVEQWRQYVIWEGGGAPPDLILSIINNESGGKSGEPAGVKTKYHRDIEKRAGGTRLVKRAYGLMQCIPLVILDFNKAHPKNPVYWEDMSGTDGNSGRLQIRVGCWLFNNMVRALHRDFPQEYPGTNAGNASPEQLTAALVAYARGYGALREKLNILKSKGLPLTQAQLHESFPLWGYSHKEERWVNRPLYYSAKVWRLYLRNKTGAPGTLPPENPSGQPATRIARRPAVPPAQTAGASPFPIPVLLLLAAYVGQKLFKK